MSEYRHLSPKEQKAYIKARNERIVTLNVGEPEIKAAIKAAADADGRTVNNWLRVYIVPLAKKEVAAQLAAAKGKKRD
jgi:hypothetical protein